MCFALKLISERSFFFPSSSLKYHSASVILKLPIYTSSGNGKVYKKKSHVWKFLLDICHVSSEHKQKYSSLVPLTSMRISAGPDLEKKY